MPQLPFDFTFNIDESSANRVEKRIADIDNAVSKIGSSSAKGKVVGVDESTIKSFERLGGATKRYALDQEKSFNSAKNSILGLGNDVNKTSKTISTDLSKGASLSAVQIEELDHVMKELNETTSKTRVGVGHTSSGLKNLGVDARNLNKSTANANQTLFAFSDLVQDSTQFTQGFSQGMRAIGNNVGFTAELFANMKNRVDLYNESIIQAGGSQEDFISVSGQLKKSLKGFGGVLIAINAAFVVGQIFADRQREAYKKLQQQAQATAEGLSKIAEEFSSAMGGGVPDPFGIRKREIQIKILGEQLANFSAEQAKATLTSQAFAKESKVVAIASESATTSLLNLDGALEKIGSGIRYAFGLDNTAVGRNIISYTQFLNQATKDYNDTIDTLVETGELPEWLGYLEYHLKATNTQIPAFVGEAIKLKDTSISLEKDIERLGNVFGDKTQQKLEGFADAMTEFIENPVKKITEMFPNASYGLAKFLGKISEADQIRYESMRELAIEQQKLIDQQNAYNALLEEDGNASLKKYVEGLDLLSKASTIHNTELFLMNSRMFDRVGLMKKEGENITAAIQNLKDLSDALIKEANDTELSTEQREKSFMILSMLIPVLSQYVDAEKKAKEELERITESHTIYGSRLEELEVKRNREIKKINELEESYKMLAAEADAARIAVNNFYNALGRSTVADDVSQIAKAAGQFGEVFNASKEFRLAMATIDGAAAIVSVLADPRLGLVQKIAGATTIAAATAAQIQQIRNTELGSSSAPKVSNYGVGANTRFLPTSNNQEDVESFRAFGESVNFMPKSASMFGEDKIIIEQNIKGKDLSLLVRSGNKELKSSQVVV
jgi:hypothetical protein